jgi:putative ABC transport system permease protein
MAVAWRDLRFAVRLFLKDRGFTLIALLALALGIGANTAIFSVVNAVLVLPLPFRDPNRLAMVWENSPRTGKQNVVNPQNFADWQIRNRSFESMAAYVPFRLGMSLTGDGEAEEIPGTYVTRDFLSVLGIQPFLGRDFRAEDDTINGQGVVLISYGLWQRRYGSDPKIVGRKLIRNGNSDLVVGVLAPGFHFPEMTADIWVLHHVSAGDQRGGRYLAVVARLRPGVTVVQAQEDMTGIARQLEQEQPFDAKWGAIVTPMRQQFTGSLRDPLLVLLGAVGFVLLIACVNVANLLLARAEARQREIAIRKALGASTGQLVRQFTIEGLLLSLAGAGLGLLLAAGGLKVMVAAGKASLPRAGEVKVDPTVLAVTIAISLLTALFFGLAPLAQIAGGTLHDALKAAAGRGSAGSVSSNRFRSALVSSELALALILLIGTGLMIRAFWKLSEVDPGFRSEGLLTLRVNLPTALYPTPANLSRFWHEAEEKLAALPGVTSATVMYGLPPQRPIDANDTDIENFTMVPGGPGKNIDYYQFAGDHFFETMGIRLLDGRLFDARDVDGAPATVIVNQTMARTYYGNASALGHRIRPGFQGPWCTIVGVVEDVKNAGLDKPAGSELFLPERQGNPVGQVYFAIRTAGDPHSLIDAVRAAIRSVDPSLPLAQIRTMDEVLDGARSRPRFLTTLLSFFSFTALLLAAVGLYGVIAYSVTRRMTEFGIRMAMGARASDVLGMVLTQGLKLTAAGVVAGAVGALALTRLISGLLFGVSAFDPVTFCAMALLLGLVTVAACIIPGLRATKVDPLVALRYE